jgi:hypothetical protein
MTGPFDALALSLAVALAVAAAGPDRGGVRYLSEIGL